MKWCRQIVDRLSHLFKAERQLHGVQGVPLGGMVKLELRGQQGKELHLAATHILDAAGDATQCVASWPHLILHEQLCVPTLLVTLVLEVLGKAGQAHVVAIKVGIHCVVYIRDVVLDAVRGVEEAAAQQGKVVRT